MNTNANTAEYVSATKNMRFRSIDDERARMGNKPYSAQPPPRAYYDPFEWQLYYGGVVYDSTTTSRQSSSTNMSEEDDGIGCMLHDLGEDCMFCGDVSEEQKPEKFDDPEKERRLDISSDSGSLFDGIAFHSNTFENWLPGLGRPKPTRKSPPAPSDSVLAVLEACGSCGTEASPLKVNGPGHCVECRYRWLHQYRAERASKAGMTAPREKKAEVDVLEKKHSRYDWIQCY